MKKFWKWLIGDWWEVRACGWPYSDGFATFNRYRHCILDTGLTRERAQEICDAMNNSEGGNG